MYLCFVDESGNYSIEDQTNRFFILCSLQIRDLDIIRFEERFSKLFKDYKLPMKGNLKKIRRARYDYKPFDRFGMKKKQSFYTDLYTLLNESPVSLIASVINKENLRLKYIRPDPPLERAYKHLLERINYFLSEEKDMGIIIFDENYEKDKIRRKHLYWKTSGTEWTGLGNIYRSPFFIREEESYEMQIVDLCAYNIFLLFNQEKSDYFEHIRSLFHCYKSKETTEVAIKVFPVSGEKTEIYKCERFVVHI
jgi:hypothetical protein